MNLVVPPACNDNRIRMHDGGQRAVESAAQPHRRCALRADGRGNWRAF